MDKNFKKQTIAIDTPFARRDPYGSISIPIYNTVAYEFENAADMADAFTGRVLVPDYSRVMNPTVSYFEDKVKALTGAANVFSFNSGMAAISNIFLAIAGTGKNIVTSRHLFGNSYALLTKTLKRFGVEARFVDLTDIDAVDAVIDADTSCIYLEIITNPQMEVADLRVLSEIAHRHNIPLVADTTMIPFTKFSAKELGVDVEVVSSTKYISGGATALGGLIIDYGTFPEVNKTIRFELLFNIGSYMTPQAAYMQSLGLETLDARYRVQSQNAVWIARRLEGLKEVKVNSLALDSHPYHEIANEQFGGSYGAMLTLELASEQACYDFINNLKLIRRATNLFDNKTLAIHPYSTIFGNFTPEEKAAMDVLPTLIRISVGLEDIEDIYDDIIQALGL
ncbi:MAG: PLP-dependent transferase [Bacteroidaceae bacterium]|nr:PLP-dependent transferase [Bacteroidaceae bacterium]